jgi:hypothetical protein
MNPDLKRKLKVFSENLNRIVCIISNNIAFINNAVSTSFLEIERGSSSSL